MKSLLDLLKKPEVVNANMAEDAMSSIRRSTQGPTMRLVEIETYEKRNPSMTPQAKQVIAAERAKLHRDREVQSTWPERW